MPGHRSCRSDKRGRTSDASTSQNGDQRADASPKQGLRWSWSQLGSRRRTHPVEIASTHRHILGFRRSAESLESTVHTERDAGEEAGVGIGSPRERSERGVRDRRRQADWRGERQGEGHPLRGTGAFDLGGSAIASDGGTSSSRIVARPVSPETTALPGWRAGRGRIRIPCRPAISIESCLELCLHL